MVNVDQESLRLLAEIQASGIPKQNKWGEDTNKRFPDLEDEVNKRDAILSVQNSIYIRHVTTAHVYVFAYRRKWFLGKEHLYVLHEDWQKFHQRKKKPRKHRNHFYVSEKIHPEEDPTKTPHAPLGLAMGRAIEEELKIPGIALDRFMIHDSIGDVKKPKKSETYPGIQTQKTVFRSSVLLQKPEIRTKYVEHQEDKDTKFSWKRVDKVDNERVQEYAQLYRRRDKPPTVSMVMGSRHGHLF